MTNGATNHLPRMVIPGGATREEAFDGSLAEAIGPTFWVLKLRLIGQSQFKA